MFHTFTYDLFQDIEDIDFQTDTTSMSARWTGFAHSHVVVTYSINIGTSKGGNDILDMKDVGTSLAHTESGLSLVPYTV